MLTPKELEEQQYIVNVTAAMVLQFTCWWNAPAWTIDDAQLKYGELGLYDEEWLPEFLEEQRIRHTNYAWWALETNSPYKKPPLYFQIFVAFFGLYWLQMIFTTGLNTLYYKELDQVSLITTAIMTVGIYLIFANYKRISAKW